MGGRRRRRGDVVPSSFGLTVLSGPQWEVTKENDNC